CRTALCGAEMIRAETGGAFAAAFARHGFSPEAFRPCYGLAEATLAVTMDTRGRGVRTREVPVGGGSMSSGSLVVATGEPLPGTDIRIVSPANEVLGRDAVGEVEVRGPSISPGYFADDAATAASHHGIWLRTGDLGFVGDGELYITGRIKDVIILNGEN